MKNASADLSEDSARIAFKSAPSMDEEMDQDTVAGIAMETGPKRVRA